MTKKHFTEAQKHALRVMLKFPDRTGYYYPVGATNGAAGLAGGKEPLVQRIRSCNRWNYRLTKEGRNAAEQLEAETSCPDTKLH